MRIHCPRSVVKASLSALCVMSLAGCAGDDDSSATASDSGESSAAMEAVENEVESRMQMEDDGDDPDAMVESGSSEESYEAGGESEMDHEMDGTSGMPSGGVSPFHQQPTQVVARPADVMQWTSAQVLDAVEEKDSAVLQAIQAKAAGSQGDPEFAQLMTQVLQKSSGQEMGGSAGGSGFGLPGLG